MLQASAAIVHTLLIHAKGIVARRGDQFSSFTSPKNSTHTPMCPNASAIARGHLAISDATSIADAHTNSSGPMMTTASTANRQMHPAPMVHSPIATHVPP